MASTPKYKAPTPFLPCASVWPYHASLCHSREGGNHTSLNNYPTEELQKFHTPENQIHRSSLLYLYQISYVFVKKFFLVMTHFSKVTFESAFASSFASSFAKATEDGQATEDRQAMADKVGFVWVCFFWSLKTISLS